MIDEAWKLYRGWAARARQKQASARRWNQVALAMVVLTAFLGTLSSQLGPGSKIVVWITVVSAVITAISGWLGREAMAVESESKWVKARGFAEAVKSECFRFAGGAGAYAAGGDSAAAAFAERIRGFRADLGDLALAPGDPTPPPGGSQPPPSGMGKDWYLKNRVGEQRGYFEKSLTRSEGKIFWYRLIALGSMVLAALCTAVAGLTSVPVAPWTGVITTISAAFIAAGLNERTQAVAAAAARMINQLDDIVLGKDMLDLAGLVDRTENALQEENMQWRETMKKTRSAGAPPAGAKPAPEAAAAEPPAE